MGVIPDVTETIRDGGLGVALPNTNGVQAFVGVSSAGTVNTVYQFSDPQTLKDTLGTGPLVELAALVLQECGGPVVCVRATASVSGTLSAVTAGSGNTGASVATVTGAPLDTYQVQVQIITGAATPGAGTAVFRYSLDNGRTWSGNIAAASTYVIPNTGITLALSAATLVAGDSYTFTSVAPSYAVSPDLANAMTALLADPSTWFCVNIIGVPATAGTSALFSAVSAQMTTAQTGYRYCYARIQAEDGADSAVISAVSSFVSTRVDVCGGFCVLNSAVSGSDFTRPVAWMAAVQAGLSAPQEDLAKVRNGPVQVVQSLVRDEAKTPGFDAARMTSARTFVGLPGYFLTNGRLMSSPGSDFTYQQFRRVMDIACKNVRQSGLQYLNDSVTVNKTTGLISDVDANAIDHNMTELLRAAILQPGYCSDATCTLDRTVNVLSTGQFVIRVRIVPLGYIKAISLDIGFTNPALAS